MPPIHEAAALIAALGLRPHPEGGHYREIFRAPETAGARGAVTTIYYLLRAGERSHWHRVDATEIWHHYAGDALALGISEDGRTVTRHRLGKDIAAGEQPQLIVPAHAWQSAEPLGAYTLVGCTVAPAFRFEGFELAPPGWAPGKD
jgi:predicted cupin superfamily sugar epimerase